jgi:hypothetical protein
VYENPWRPCEHCQARKVKHPCYKLLGPNTQSKLDPSRPPPTPSDAVIEPEEALLLDFIYTEKILRVETRFSSRTLFLLKFFAKDTVFGPSIRCPTLRYAMLAVAEFSLDRSALLSPRSLSYLQKALRALPSNPENCNVGDLVGMLLLVGCEAIVGRLRESVTRLFLSKWLDAEKFCQRDLFTEVLPLFLTLFQPIKNIRAVSSQVNNPSAMGLFDADDREWISYSHLLDYGCFKRSTQRVFPTLWSEHISSNSVFSEYIWGAALNMSRIFHYNADDEANGSQEQRPWTFFLASIRRSFDSDEFQLSLSTLNPRVLGDSLVLILVQYCQVLRQLLGWPTTIVEAYFRSETITTCRTIDHFLNSSSFTPGDLAAIWRNPYVDLIVTRLACLVGLGIPQNDFTGETSGDASPLPLEFHALIFQAHSVAIGPLNI